MEKMMCVFGLLKEELLNDFGVICYFIASNYKYLLHVNV